MALKFTDWNTWTAEEYGNFTRNGSLSNLSLGTSPVESSYIIQYARSVYIDRYTQEQIITSTWTIYRYRLIQYDIFSYPPDSSRYSARVWQEDYEARITYQGSLPYVYSDDNITFTIDDATYYDKERFEVSIYFDESGNLTIDEAEPLKGHEYTLDWSSPEAISKHPPRPYVEAIRQAIIERKMGEFQTPFFNGISPIPSTSVVPITQGSHASRSLFTALYLCVRGLLPEYVDLSQTESSFHNSDDRAKTYDLDSILPDIGDTELKDLTILAEWTRQQYLILCQLVWKYGTYGNNPKDPHYEKELWTPVTGGWDSAKTEFATMAWSPGISLWGFSSPYPPAQFARIYSGRYIIRRTRLGVFSQPMPSMNRDVDFYRKLEVHKYIAASYLDPDYGIDEDRFGMVASAVSHFGNDPIYIGDIAECTMPEPNADGSTNLYMGTYDSAYYIAKFNVPGGFTFQGASFPTAPILSSGSSWAGSILGP